MFSRATYNVLKLNIHTITDIHCTKRRRIIKSNTNRLYYCTYYIHKMSYHRVAPKFVTYMGGHKRRVLRRENNWRAPGCEPNWTSQINTIQQYYCWSNLLVWIAEGFHRNLNGTILIYDTALRPSHIFTELWIKMIWIIQIK